MYTTNFFQKRDLKIYKSKIKSEKLKKFKNKTKKILNRIKDEEIKK